MKVFPKSFFLNIFGQKTKVKVVKNLARDQGACGLYLKNEKMILIAEDQTKSEAVSTLAHEVGHCIFHRCGLSQSIDHQLEEVIVEQFAVAFLENFEIKLKKN